MSNRSGSIFLFFTLRIIISFNVYLEYQCAKYLYLIGFSSKKILIFFTEAN
jgi:hypothetical protein